MADRHQFEAVYRAESERVQRILDLFDQKAGYFPRDIWNEAQERLGKLKDHWEELKKTWRGTEVADVISEASCELYMKRDSRPDQRWMDYLYSAQGKLDYYVTSKGSVEGG